MLGHHHRECRPNISTRRRLRSVSYVHKPKSLHVPSLMIGEPFSHSVPSEPETATSWSSAPMTAVMALLLSTGPSREVATTSTPLALAFSAMLDLQKRSSGEDVKKSFGEDVQTKRYLTRHGLYCYPPALSVDHAFISQHRTDVLPTMHVEWSKLHSLSY